MKIHYLEVITNAVDDVCETYAALHGVTFGSPETALGNARVADLHDGSRIGVRAPMHDAEAPIIRPYYLVDDIAAAVKSAEAQGAEIALPHMEIEGFGTIAIYFRGETQHGLWQV